MMPRHGPYSDKPEGQKGYHKSTGRRDQADEDFQTEGCPLVPQNVKYVFRHADPVDSEEQLLWRLVAGRAVLDAVGWTGFGPSLYKKHLAAVIDAQRWWRNNWDYAQVVFDRAGIAIDGVRETMIEFFMDADNNVVRMEKEADRENHNPDWTAPVARKSRKRSASLAQA